MRDIWVREAMLDMGHRASRSSHVHLYINGLYWGIYNPIEWLDTTNFANHLSGHEKDWDNQRAWLLQIAGLAAASRIFCLLPVRRRRMFAQPKTASLQSETKTMKNSNPPITKWAGCFVVMLAVALAAGCRQAEEQDSADADSTAAPAATPARPATPAPAATAGTVVSLTPPVRIKAGVTEKMTDSQGNVWLADEGSADGETYEVADAEVTNTKDPALYRTERYSMTAYNFAIPNGKYTVKLHFAEVYTGITGTGQRVFSFNVQGHEFKDFDIWVKAGGPNKAYVESVNVEVTAGKLNITFTPNVENPKINAIEILPQT